MDTGTIVPPKIDHDIEAGVGEPATKFSYNAKLDRGRTLVQHLWSVAGKDGERKRRFLDMGGRDGKLKILLGVAQGQYDKARHSKNAERFEKRFDYYGSDIRPVSDRVLAGDFCADDYLDDKPEYVDSFDCIYSNNTFEHLARPWVTVRHIDRMLKTGGLCMIAVPFAQRYHKAPDDYFRYTHMGIISLFKTETSMKFEVLANGYDIWQRRQNIWGHRHNAMVPDELGGWRETWYSLTVLKKA